MSKIELNKITEEQKRSIRENLDIYSFIIERYNEGKNDTVFKMIFTRFYLSSQPEMRKINSDNSFKYYKLLFSNDRKYELMDVVDYLYNNLSFYGEKKYEFSFATKLLHTKYPNDYPIYDSKVFKYLKNDEGVDFKIITGKNKREKIEHNWNELNKWYSTFEEKDKWIDWFDKNFSEYKDISNYKKIDTIIFACSGY